MPLEVTVATFSAESLAAFKAAKAKREAQAKVPTISAKPKSVARSFTVVTLEKPVLKAVVRTTPVVEVSTKKKSRKKAKIDERTMNEYALRNFGIPLTACSSMQYAFAKANCEM